VPSGLKSRRSVTLNVGFSSLIWSLACARAGRAGAGREWVQVVQLT
jgi:hypothetical protein